MFSIETCQEVDGRWIAEITDLPGVMAYGQTRAEALRRVQSLALRVIADRLDHDEPLPDSAKQFLVAS
jgi:predicted RNase H-like HicB family nuclease